MGFGKAEVTFANWGVIIMSCPSCSWLLAVGGLAGITPRALLGLFVEGNSTLSFEVIPREIEDIGGGLGLRAGGESAGRRRRHAKVELGGDCVDRANG